MSKINPNKKSGASSKMIEEKLAGGAGLKAAKQDSYDLLRRSVLANLLWENNAYIDGISIAENIKNLIPLCEPVLVKNLAIEARIVQKLRHTPLFIAVCMLKHKEHSKLVKELLPVIITRADMITDFLAIYKKENGNKLKPIANSVKKGLSLSFNNFNEYQLAKYDRNGDIKLRDALFLIHAKPKKGNEELFNKIANRELKTPDTWEVALSTGKNKKETWERLISENKLGGLAFLRNMRNMIQVDVNSNIIRKGLKELNTNMLLPLNFLTAAKYAPQFKTDINEAFLRAYKNMPKLKGRSIFIVDVSGSMNSAISSNSEFTRYNVACIMTMLAMEMCEEVDIYITAGRDMNWTHYTEKLKYPARGFNLLDQIDEIKKRSGGGGIFTRQALEFIRKEYKGTPERIIVFSDSQDMDRHNKTPNPFGLNNYIVDVAAHKNGINYKNVWTAEISGWSEHFLTYIAAYEGIKNNFEDNE